MLTNYWKFQNRNVQTFGFIYHDTNGLNHGPVWKTQSFLLNAICTVILWQDYYGKGNLRKSYWSTVGRRFPMGYAYSYTVKKGYSYLHVDDIKLAEKETKPWSDVETTQQRSRFGRTNIFPWSCILGLHSKTMWNKQRYCGQLQNHVRIANFRGGSREITIPSKSSYFSMVFLTWLVMQRNVWNDMVSWQTKRPNNSTKYLLPASMTTTSKKKKWNLLENCQKYALKLFWNPCTWQELEDLIFYDQWTNLHDQSQNGPKPVTNAWIDWFHIFITHVNTNNIVMWVILQNNAVWDCFKTLTSREILQIRNPLLEGRCAFLEVIHLFQSVGCVRNKLQCRTVQQNLKSSLWMLDWD